MDGSNQRLEFGKMRITERGVADPGSDETPEPIEDRSLIRGKGSPSTCLNRAFSGTAECTEIEDKERSSKVSLSTQKCTKTNPATTPALGKSGQNSLRDRNGPDLEKGLARPNERRKERAATKRAERPSS